MSEEEIEDIEPEDKEFPEDEELNVIGKKVVDKILGKWR